MPVSKFASEILIAGGLAVLLAGLLIGLGLARRRVLRRVEQSRRLGREGAERALDMLARAGYRVLDTEVVATGVVHVDGAPFEYTVRADAIVRRFFRRYVAEFKGGPASAGVDHRGTRRQLLEYAVVFDCAGVLLVDADAGEIHRVEFPFVT